MYLRSNRTPEDLSTYDFIDLTKATGEDGVWNFEAMNNDDPPGTPNNNALNAQYNLWDLANTREYSDLPNETDYDFLDMMSDGSRSGEDDHKYDFGDIVSGEEGSRRKRQFEDPARIEYNFGDLRTDPDSVILKTLELMFNKAFEAATSLEFRTGRNDTPTPILPQIETQWFYSYYNNTAYIEFKFNSTFYVQYQQYIDRIIDKVISFIKCNFRKNAELDYTYNMKVYTDIIEIDDGVHEIADSYFDLTPFAIGYWQSLYGGYRFIADKAHLANMFVRASAVSFPEFDAAVAFAYEQYYDTDFERFVEIYTELAHQYKIDQDIMFDKDMQEYIDKVTQIRKNYGSKPLTLEKQNQYITRQEEILSNYVEDPAEYARAMKALNQEFGVGVPMDSIIPSMFEDYTRLHEEYFHLTLPGFVPYVRRSYLTFYTYEEE